MSSIETDEYWLSLLEEDTKPKSSKYPVTPQDSKYVRWIVEVNPCLSRGCRSPTSIRVSGIPLCSVHAIQTLADLLDEKVNHYPNRPRWIEDYLKALLANSTGEEIGDTRRDDSEADGRNEQSNSSGRAGIESSRTGTITGDSLSFRNSGKRFLDF